MPSQWELLCLGGSGISCNALPAGAALPRGQWCSGGLRPLVELCVDPAGFADDARGWQCPFVPGQDRARRQGHSRLQGKLHWNDNLYRPSLALPRGFWDGPHGSPSKAEMMNRHGSLPVNHTSKCMWLGHNVLETIFNNYLSAMQETWVRS